MGKLKSYLQKWLIFFITAYRYLISPLLGNRCRFYPSCSHYAIEAIRLYGNWKGCVMALKRILRCHPWHPGGVDPISERKPKC